MVASIILQSIEQRGKGRSEKASTSKSEAQKPKLGHKGPREQIIWSTDPTGRKKHIREGKGQAWYQHWQQGFYQSDMI